jgi:hypothetical protein
MDIYRGPISAEGLAILECVGKRNSAEPSSNLADFYGVVAVPKELLDTYAHTEKADQDRQWHRFLDFLKAGLDTSVCTRGLHKCLHKYTHMYAQEVCTSVCTNLHTCLHKSAQVSAQVESRFHPHSLKPPGFHNP